MSSQNVQVRRRVGLDANHTQDSNPPGDVQQQASPLLLTVHIKDLRVLQRCYLPFLKRGGLFVPGTRSYSLRQRLFLLITLPALPGVAGQMTTHALNVTVAWLTPAQAQGGRDMGVGLHFDLPEDEQFESDIRRSIESLLKALV